MLELAVLFGGAAGFYAGGYRIAGVVVALLILVSSAFSLDRLRWLLKQ